MTEKLLTQVQSVRRALAENGPPRTRREDLDFSRVSFPQQAGDALRDTLLAHQAATVVEIGLAYGSSALAIGEALAGTASASASRSASQHLIIDPFQESAWAGAGWEVVRQAGLGPVTTLVTEPSQVVLARLVGEGFQADAAFVDGSHSYHNVFVDLYFLRTVVRPGGLVILDDVWAPSVATAVRYFETNLGWVPVASPLDDVVTDADGQSRARAYRLPDSPPEPGFKEFTPFW